MEKERSYLGRFGMVDIAKIVPNEIKIKENDNDVIKEKFDLVIEKFGQLQSIIIAKVGDEYRVIDGNEQLLWMKKQSIEKAMCCYLGEMNEKDYLIYRMFFNMNVKRLNYVGIAEIISKVCDNDYDVKYVANKTGLDIADISNYKDLLKFDWDMFLKEKPSNQMDLFGMIEEDRV